MSLRRSVLRVVPALVLGLCAGGLISTSPALAKSKNQPDLKCVTKCTNAMNTCRTACKNNQTCESKCAETLEACVGKCDGMNQEE